jgi:CRISPR system Cascade subunit CasB
MYRYVEPFLSEKRGAAQESAYYLAASLFALQPKSIDEGNLGTHMAAARTGNDDALERRFTALLNAHRDDLPEYLRHTISFLKSKEQPINWNQLFWDLQRWDDENRSVQKQWASAFWGRTNLTRSAAEETEETD